MSSLSIILLSPVKKVVLSESEEKYTQIKLFLKTVQNSNKQLYKCWWTLMWEDNRGWTFSLQEACVIMDYGLWMDMDIDQDYFGQKQGFQV